MLSYPDYLAHIDADAHLLAAAAAKGRGSAVPGCPGWSVADLLDHVSRVHARSTDIVDRGLVDRWPPPRLRPDGADGLEWFRTEAHRMATVLADADPAAPAVSFSKDGTVGFWIRRMAHETLVHRVDAEQAHGYESVLDPELALDGIAETFEVFITRFPDWGEFVPGDDLVEVATCGQSWTLRLGSFIGSKGERAYDLPKAIAVAGQPPAVTIGGDPDRVMLWLWGRAAWGDVSVAGDVAAAQRFRATCSI